VASDRGRLIARYERLVELGERELELAQTGGYDALAELNAERAEIVTSLPATPPAAARPALERAAALQKQAEALLGGALAIRRSAMARLERGRAVLTAYAPAAAPAHRLDSRG
jgi:hypothetical protein